MPRISKLIPDSRIAQVAIEEGNIKSLEGRLTGKTTGIVLATIGVAMQNPDCEVYVGSLDHNSKQETLALVSRIREKIQELSLKHLEFQRVDDIQFLTYKVYR